MSGPSTNRDPQGWRFMREYPEDIRQSVIMSDTKDRERFRFFVPLVMAQDERKTIETKPSRKERTMRTIKTLAAALCLSALIGSGCTLTPNEECEKECGEGGAGNSGANGGSGNVGNNPPVNCDQDKDGYVSDWAECGGNDCDDSDAAAHPGAPEVCGDGIDNNCNFLVDDGCMCTPGNTQECYTGSSETRGVGACHDGTQACSSESAWGSCLHQQAPVNEACGNATDDDCDGAVDEECDVTDCDGDGDGHNATDCHDDSGRPQDDCNDSDGTVHPGATDSCGDGIDQDCVGGDEACTSGSATVCLHYSKLAAYSFEHVRTSYYIPDANEMIVDMGLKGGSTVEYNGIMTVPIGVPVTISPYAQADGSGNGQSLYPFDVCSYPGYFCEYTGPTCTEQPCVGMTTATGAFCTTSVGYFWVTVGNCTVDGPTIWNSNLPRPQNAQQDSTNPDWQDNDDGFGTCTGNGVFTFNP
jgi:hypothetical protein